MFLNILNLNAAYIHLCTNFIKIIIWRVDDMW